MELFYMQSVAHFKFCNLQYCCNFFTATWYCCCLYVCKVANKLLRNEKVLKHMYVVNKLLLFKQSCIVSRKTFFCFLIFCSFFLFLYKVMYALDYN